MSTAARECLPVKFFVLDDHAYHFMQALQVQAYKRTTATILAGLDYGALAKGWGLDYLDISGPQDLEGGIRAALDHHGPVLTRVRTDYGKRPLRWLVDGKPLAPAPPRDDEMSFLEDAQVLGDAEAAHGKPLLERGERLPVAAVQLVKQAAPGGVRECPEDLVHAADDR